MNRPSEGFRLQGHVSQSSKARRRIRFAAVAALLLSACAGRAATNDIPGLVLRLNLDEPRGGAFIDAVTSNAVGRATNTRIASPGKLGSACEFANKNSYIQIADAPELNPKRLTLSLWFKTNRDPWVTRTLLEKGTAHGYALSIASGGKESTKKGKLRATVNGRDILSDAPVNDDLWHHAAATFDGETLKLYVDGNLQKQTASVRGDLAPNAYDLTLGMNRSSPSSQDKDIAFDGAIDEFALFNRALDAAELKRVISSAKPKFTKWQVERRLKELKELLDRGLILKEFYDRKVEECEVVE